MVKIKHKMAFGQTFSTNFPRADFLGNALVNVLTTNCRIALATYLADKLSNGAQHAWKQPKPNHEIEHRF
jgi:hypothetical protein